MDTFGKEEDYWDRLERLEAEAEGKSEKSSSAPSSSLMSRKRKAAAAGSHGEKSRRMHPKMMHPGVRSVQQPMLPARPRPNKTQPGRRLAGSLAPPSPQKSSSRRSLLRDSASVRGTESGKQGREGKKATRRVLLTMWAWYFLADRVTGTGEAPRGALRKYPIRHALSLEHG